MAGFFGFFDYTKPGPGVPKDAPPKAPIIVFFEIYFRKFWNLVKINLMFNFFNLPALIAAIFATMYLFQGQISDDPTVDLLTRFIIGCVFLCIPLITVGPAQAGFTYILRNYSREEHAFLWWDFKDTAKDNFKQSLIISIIDFIVFIVFGIVINFYFKYPAENDLSAYMMLFARTIVILAFIIYLMMHMYIYPMLITFKLTVRQVYRNALIFAMAKFLPNLGILLLCIFLILLSFYFSTFIGIFLYLFITVSTIGLIINFYVYPKLKKYMIDKIESEDEDEEDEDEENEYDEAEDDEAKDDNEDVGYEKDVLGANNEDKTENINENTDNDGISK
ncbi:MAG TPA: YesL family protein [Clostridiaceae bacterium]|nr:YesL family protein [Clostridiaceae bacterium]